MDKTTRADIPLAAQFACAASPSGYRDLAGPFFHELMLVLDEAGFGNTDADYIRDNFDPPSSTFYPPMRGRPSNDADFLNGIFIGVALFIGSSIGQWAISKLCDDVYERATRSTRWLGHLIGRLTPGDRTVTVALDHWFDSSGVLVRVECRLRAGEPRDVVDALVPVALRRAVAWIEDHGVTHRVVTYCIDHGKLADSPKLSEPVSTVD